MKEVYIIHIFWKREKTKCIPDFFIKAIYGVKNERKYKTQLPLFHDTSYIHILNSNIVLKSLSGTQYNSMCVLNMHRLQKELCNK